MVYPTTPAPVKVRIAPGANPAGDPDLWVWTDVTSSVRVADGISITQGRMDELGRVSPGTCNLRFDNRTGNFTPRNPLGAYYGQLRRNTPIRVVLRRVEDSFTRTVSNGWGDEPSFGTAYTRHNGSAAHFSVTGSVGRIEVTSTSGDRVVSVDAGSSDHEVTAVLQASTVPTGGTARQGLVGRFTDINNHYRAIVAVDTAGVVTAEITTRIAGVLTALTAVTTSLVYTSNIVCKFACEGELVKLKVWQDGSPEPIPWTIDITDSTVPLGTRCGTFARRETSNLTPTLFDFDNFTVDIDRFSGFVAEWPPRWDKSTRNASVPIEARGILGRLGAGSTPTRSAMHWQVLQEADATSGLIAYWPMEDVAGSTSVAPAYGGVAMSTTGGVVFGDVTGPSGSENLPSLSGGGVLRTRVDARPGSTKWRIEWIQQVDDVTGADHYPVTWTTLGTLRWWRLRNDNSGTLVVEAYDVAEVEQLAGALAVSVDVFDGKWYHVRVECEQNGADLFLAMYADSVDGVTSATDTHTEATQTIGDIRAVQVNPFGAGTAAGLKSVGHVLVAYTDVSINKIPALNGFAGDTALVRFAGLCTQAGVQYRMRDVFATGQKMGPQRPQPWLDLLRECEDVDQGVIYEAGYGLGFLPHVDRENGAVALALDVDQKHLAAPPEPTDDDQRLRNQWRVTRTGGSFAIASDQTNIDANGVYDSALDANVYDDGQLPDLAGWLVHVGTTDEMRYPRVPLNFARSPSLITSWLACRVGSRLTIANPPDQVVGDDIDLIIEGWTEYFDGVRQWTADLNCSPAKPWMVGVWGSTDPNGTGTDNYEGSGSTLDGAHNSSTTSLSVATPAGSPLWTTDADDVPFAVKIAGEKMTVTAISGGSSPQTFTVTRSVNGVVKAQASGAAVELWQPAIYAL